MDGNFFSNLLAIVIIDLVLAGDNAILIGLAARNLPGRQRRTVIFWGTAGAIFIRAIATLIVVWLLTIPGLRLIGGLVLIWIAYGLLTEKKEDHDPIEAGKSVWGAIRTIIIADFIMGLDNVLAVAGAAQGNFVLIIAGLLISVPVMIWGSSLVVKYTERYPIIVYIGAGVLALTAGGMITSEPLLAAVFNQGLFRKWLVNGLIIGLVLFFGVRRRQQESFE